MANKTVLQIVRTVASLVGVAEPNTATGSTDVQVRQLTALCNQEGQELAARHFWNVLTNEATFTAVGAEDQGLLDGTVVPVSNGFDKILNDTIWNRTTQVGPGGPISPRSWQALKATTYAGPWAQYRIRGGRLLMFPAPIAGDTIAFEYRTKNWATNAAGDVGKSEVTADDDVPLLDSRLIQLGLIWRWKSAKGLEYAQDFQNYENAVLDAMAGDGTKGTARLDGCGHDEYQPFIYVPKGNWAQ